MNQEPSFSPETISRNLPTSFIGKNIIYRPVVTSTMEVARAAAETGAPEGTVVVAERQTAGRGRLKRAWTTPEGNIAISVILRPPAAFLPCLVMMASLGVVHCIEAVAGLKPGIKWPNDVLINNKKVCGILIENKLKGNEVAYSVIGLGININLRVADFPEISDIATSLSDECGRQCSRQEVLQRLLVEMEKWYRSPPEIIFRQWRERLVILGRRVTVGWGDAVYEGIAEAVAADGSLLLRQDNGELVRFVAGDATLRR